MSNNRYVKEIAEELNHYAWGHVYVCPCCQCESVICNEMDEAPLCTDCGDDMVQVSMWEHLNDMDIYDIEYRVDSRHADYIKSVRICVALGGPNVYVDTATKTVDLYWWMDEAHADLSSEAVEDIEAFFNDLWNCE